MDDLVLLADETAGVDQLDCVYRAAAGVTLVAAGILDKNYPSSLHLPYGQ